MIEENRYAESYVFLHADDIVIKTLHAFFLLRMHVAPTGAQRAESHTDNYTSTIISDVYRVLCLLQIRCRQRQTHPISVCPLSSLLPAFIQKSQS